MPGNLCEHCTGMCCRYLALPIDTPEDREEFDDVRWYLLHQGVSVFVEDGEWYLYVATDCRHLQPDYRCGLYETRPRICRKYTTVNCDYHSGEYGWEQHFTCPEHLDEFVREYFADKDESKSKSKPKAESKRPRLKARLSKLRPNDAKPDYSGKTTDIAGKPLPPLGVRR